MTISLATELVAALVGLCAGSFASTAAVRMARGESFVAGRSHCDGCGVSLGFAATVPVVSYVAYRGACSACGNRIDPAHPLGEIAGAVIAVAAVAAAPMPRALLIAALAFVLLTTVIVDMKSRRLPDVLTAVIAVLAIGLAFQVGWLRLLVGLIAGLAALGTLELVRRGYARIRRAPGLGFGDVKLMGALAIWLGVLTPWAVVIGSAVGLGAVLIARPRDGRIAFGPALATGALVVGLLGEAQLWPLS